jgi:pimeloyl-ACP methyl ester carboxylesterase
MDMTEQQTMIETNVGSLAVQERGEGRPAVLWHSLFMDERSWDRVEEDLSAERPLVLITGPGHGASADPGRRYTLEECAAAAATVLDVLGISEPVDWVGNAWGGHVGVIFAATSPARCRTLVTLGTPVQAYRAWERVQTLLLLLLYRLLGPVRFIQNGVADTLLSPRTRAEDIGLGRDHAGDSSDRRLSLSDARGRPAEPQ